MPVKAPRHFDRYRALIKGGWLSILSPNEQAMWHVYEQHAAPDGESAPSGREIARLIGHANDNNIGRLRKALVEYGLIEVLAPGAGRGNVCRVRVLVPPSIPNKTPQNRGGIRAAKTPQSQQQNPSQPTNKTPQTERALNKEEQPIQQPISTAAMPREDGDEEVRDDRVANLPDVRPAEDDGKPAMAPTPKLRMSPEQSKTWAEFKHWFSREGWPQTHLGAAYGFDGGRDPRACHKILSNPNVNWNIETAKAIALCFADDRNDAYLRNRGHRLIDLAERVDVYAIRVKQGHAYANRKPAATSRGEYASSLPSGSRKLG